MFWRGTYATLTDGSAYRGRYIHRVLVTYELGIAWVGIALCLSGCGHDVIDHMTVINRQIVPKATPLNMRKVSMVDKCGFHNNSINIQGRNIDP